MPLFLYYIDKLKAFYGILISAIITISFKMLNFKNPINLVINYILSFKDRMIISYLLFIVIGAYCGKNYNKFILFLKNKKIIVFSIYLTTSALHTYFSYLNFRGVKFYTAGEIIHLLFCTVSILTLYIVSIDLSKITSVYFNKCCLVLSEHSYYIYLSHPLFIFISKEILYKYNIKRISHRLLFTSVFVLINSFLFSFIYKRIINILSGQKKYIKINEKSAVNPEKTYS